MGVLRKFKWEIVAVLGILLIFFFTRLYNIMSLPLFTDEAIYVRWSQIARYDAAWRFISLTDGKQPSFVWLTLNVMRFVSDPLLAGRLVSVFAGLASMIGLFFLGREIFRNKIVGLFSSILYLIFPMAIVYDRMALYDSLVGMFTVWSLYFIVLLVRNLRLDIALILGMVAGGAVLTKTSGFFNLYLLPFSLLLFDLSKKDRFIRFIKWVGLALLVVILAYGYYSIQRLSPFFHIIDEKNTVFVYPFNEWREHPFRFFEGNLKGLWDWFITYVTWPVFSLMVASFFFYRNFTREKLLLLIWFLPPFLALALFGKTLYPRFIFFMVLPLLPLAALTLLRMSVLIRRKIFFACCILLFAALMLRSDYYILTDFARAPIPFSDRDQYFNNWPAGGGIAEIIAFLQQESEKGKIYVASEGTFGSLPTYAVEIYLGDNKNVDKGGIWPVPDEVPEDLVKKAEKMTVYMIFNQTQEVPNWPLQLVEKYQKGVGDSYISLYKVEPSQLR